MRIQFNAGDVLPEVNLRVETGEQRWIRPFAEQRSNLTVRGNLTPRRPPYVVKPLRPLFVLPRQQNWGQVFQLIAHASDSNGLLPTCMPSASLLYTPLLGRWQFTHRDGHERRVERNLSWLLRSDTLMSHQSDQRHRSYLIPTLGQKDDTSRLKLAARTSHNTFRHQRKNHLCRSYSGAGSRSAQRLSASTKESHKPSG